MLLEMYVTNSFCSFTDCTYSNLTQGHISDRLQNTTDKALLLDYLITELMGSRILQHKKPDKKIELKLVRIIRPYGMGVKKSFLDNSFFFFDAFESGFNSY